MSWGRLWGACELATNPSQSKHLEDAENYLKGTETEIPRQEKRKKQCEELIATLDTAFAEKQALDARIQKLEEGALETNSLLKQVLKKLDK